MNDRQGHLRTYKTPLQPAPEPWITLAELVRRIEWFRAHSEPLVLSLPRLGRVAVHIRRAS